MKFLQKILLAIMLVAGPAAVSAQDAPAPAPVVESAAGGEAEILGAENVENEVAEKEAVTAPVRAPVPTIGLPQPAEMDFQEQFSPTGRYAKWMNNVVLLPLITVISLFVLALLVWVVVRYRRGANPVPSKTTHNTFIEVIWTLVPVLILVVIAVPSIGLIAKQYQPAPDDAVTVKVTGYQWYWGYSYPDHGGFEVISNMLPEEADAAEGARFRTDADGPRLLGVDNRMVVPAGVPLRIQTTAADVIHSFAVPALWFKIDSVPGRLNERTVTIEKPGVYFGQCSELCGARHAFMPIAVEAVTPAEFAVWIRSQGGSMPSDEEVAGDTTSPGAVADGGAEDDPGTGAEEPLTGKPVRDSEI